MKAYSSRDAGCVRRIASVMYAEVRPWRYDDSCPPNERLCLQRTKCLRRDARSKKTYPLKTPSLEREGGNPQSTKCERVDG